MVRKVLSFALIFVIIFAMALTVFGYDDPPETIVYPCMPFDSVVYDGDVTLEFSVGEPMVEGVVTHTWTDSVNGGTLQETNVSLERTGEGTFIYNYSFYDVSVSDVEFRFDVLYYDYEGNESAMWLEVIGGEAWEVGIEFDVDFIVKSGYQYQVVQQHVIIPTGLIDGQYLRIDNLIDLYIDKNLTDILDVNHVLRFSNVVLSVRTSAGSNIEYGCYGSYTNNQDQLSQWVEHQNLFVMQGGQEGYADVGGFLTGVLGSFWDFEFLPNVTIGGILEIVATVAVVLWLITLMV